MSKTAQPLNVVILGPAHPLRPGGITTFNERLCRAFDEAGHHCTIWSFKVQYPKLLFPGSSQFTDAPAPEGIRIIPKVHSYNPFNWLQTGKALRAERPHLLVVRYWIPFMAPALGTILRQVKKNYHTRIVCIADNIVPHEGRFADALLTRYFVKAVDHFMVMSQQVLKQLQGFTSKPATLLPHPLYDNFGEPVSRQEAIAFLKQQLNVEVDAGKNTLLFFGLIRKYKGLDLLLEALQLVEQDDVQVIVAGEFYEARSNYEPALGSAIAAGTLVLHQGFVRSEHVRYFASAAHGIIQPYRSATQSGVTPMAYHFNKPMIVTNVGGLPEMVPHQHAGIVCEPNAASIAKAIGQFFRAGPQAFALGVAEMKQKLSWQKMVEEICKAADLSHETPTAT